MSFKNKISLQPEDKSAREENIFRSANGLCHKSINAILDTFTTAAVGTAGVKGELQIKQYCKERLALSKSRGETRTWVGKMKSLICNSSILLVFPHLMWTFMQMGGYTCSSNGPWDLGDLYL